MITDLEEETEDLDWFAIDRNGDIAHFASGGRGFLPPAVMSSEDDLRSLTSFFRFQLAENSDAVESPNLLSYVRLDSHAQRETYLADNITMARKGLYSFDCIIGPSRPAGYFIVARPTVPLNLRVLPPGMRSLLLKTIFNGTFRDTEIVNAGDLM